MTESPRELAIILDVPSGIVAAKDLLEQVYAQQYEMQRLEVAVVGKEWSTVDRGELDKYRGRFGTFVLLDNPSGKSSVAKNVGIKNTKNPLIVPLSEVIQIRDANLLQKIAVQFESGSVPYVTMKQTYLTDDQAELPQAVAFSRQSLLGDRPFQEQFGSDLHLAGSSLVALRREVIEQTGLFDEDVSAEEDTELLWRMHRSGIRGSELPENLILKRPLSSVRMLARESFTSGYSWFHLGLRHGYHSPQHWIVAAYFGTAAFFMAVALLFPSAAGVARLLLALYLIIIIFFSIYLLVKHQRLSCLLFGIVLFPAMHVGRAVGFLKGLYEYMRTRKM